MTKVSTTTTASMAESQTTSAIEHIHRGSDPKVLTRTLDLNIRVALLTIISQSLYP